MIMQIWRHRPSGRHYAIYMEDSEVMLAKGPMTAREAADITASGFGESESDAAAVAMLNAAPWEYDPVWQDRRGDQEDAEWLRAVMDPGDDSMHGRVRSTE